MFTTHPRSSATEQDVVPGDDRPDPAPYLIDWRMSLRLAERACCCPAKPAVVVIMPPGASRPAPSELLLCRHHYVASEGALVSCAAAVFDASGVPLTAHTRSLVQAAR